MKPQYIIYDNWEETESKKIKLITTTKKEMIATLQELIPKGAEKLHKGHYSVGWIAWGHITNILPILNRLEGI